jgi:hypothetical protein
MACSRDTNGDGDCGQLMCSECGIVAENEYIRIGPSLTPSTGKTQHFDVVNRRAEFLLGQIRWYGAWRQYCFFPNHDGIFNKGCLDTIAEFCDTADEAST